MQRYIVALGSSHEQGKEYINETKKALQKKSFIVFSGESRIYKNSATNTHFNCLFFNCAVSIMSHSHPHVLFRELLSIEHTMGRVRTYRNARRTIDIDVLLSLDFTYKSSNFFVPHRSLWERSFFVIPAIEALKSAGWPILFSLLHARRKLGDGIFIPLP